MSYDLNTFLNAPFFPEDPILGLGGEFDEQAQATSVFTNEDLALLLSTSDYPQPGITTSNNRTMDALNTPNVYDAFNKFDMFSALNNTDLLGLGSAAVHPQTSQQQPIVNYSDYYLQTSTMFTAPVTPVVPSIVVSTPTSYPINPAQPVQTLHNQSLYALQSTATGTPPVYAHFSLPAHMDMASPSGTAESASTPYREESPLSLTSSAPLDSSFGVDHGFFYGYGLTNSSEADTSTGGIGIGAGVSTNRPISFRDTASRTSRIRSHAPYSKEDRSQTSTLEILAPSTSAITSSPAPKSKRSAKSKSARKLQVETQLDHQPQLSSSPSPSATSMSTPANVSDGQVPLNAVWSDSPEEDIKAAMDLLARLITTQREASSPDAVHKYFTCPVLDCKRGGWNDLLYNKRTSAPSSFDSPQGSKTQATSLQSPGSLDQAQVQVQAQDQAKFVFPTGRPFYGLTELKRHVISCHAKSALAIFYCPHPGCGAQAARDAQAEKEGRIGKGYFCRIEPLLMHFSEFPEHWESVSQEMRLELKMFRNGGPSSST